MIAGAVPALRPARPTQPNITNRSNPHYDETLLPDGAAVEDYVFQEGPADLDVGVVGRCCCYRTITWNSRRCWMMSKPTRAFRYIRLDPWRCG
jgi:hypothetical protein